MALKIRLRRMGRKKAPHYRIVVAESSMPRDGRFVANVGHYNPTTNPTTLVVNRDLALSWLAKGAMPTDTVQSLFKQAGVYREPSAVEGAAEAVAAAATKAAGAVKAAAGTVAETATAAAATVVETVRDAAEAVAERVAGGEETEAAPVEAAAAPAEETEAAAAPAEEPAPAEAAAPETEGTESAQNEELIGKRK